MEEGSGDRTGAGGGAGREGGESGKTLIGRFSKVAVMEELGSGNKRERAGDGALKAKQAAHQCQL